MDFQRLREIAHWLIAGKQCRYKIMGIGKPGRDEKQQLLFQQVEAKPQAVSGCYIELAEKNFI